MNNKYLLLIVLCLISCSKVNLERTDDVVVKTFQNINAIYPVNNTYGTNSELIFQIEYSEDVTVIGNPQLVIEIGSNIVGAGYVSGSSTKILEFQYVINNGQIDNNGIVVKGLNFSNGLIKNEANESSSVSLKESNKLLNEVKVDTLILSPDKVTNLVSAPSPNNDLNLSWQKPNGNGNTIIDYSLQYREEGTQLWIDI